MSGKCFSCASQFGFFKKEVGCPNCGFAFCKDCLKKKIAVPKHKNEILKVCNKCYNIMSGKTSGVPPQHSPPEALKKHLAALEQRGENVPVHTGKAPHKAPSTQSSSQSYRGMSREDIALQKRLDNLREERQKALPPTPSTREIEARLQHLKADKKPAPSDEEMARRLAVLKGQDPDTVNQPPLVLKPTPQKTQQQQIDDLLAEICDEVNIDNAQGQGQQANLPLVSNGQGENDEGDQSLSELSDVSRLMQEVAGEMQVDAQRALQGLQQDKELMDRLNQLKKDRKNEGASEGKNSKDSESSGEDSEDEEQAIKKILKQAVEQNQLDEDFAESGSVTTKSISSESTSAKTKPPDGEEVDPDELPWCCICNEDASVRCVGCDYDLYCQRCFKQGHEQMDMPDHRTVPFKPPKSDH